MMQRDKRLLWFPILSGMCTVLVAIIFLMPVAFQRTGHGLGSAEHWQAVANSIYAPRQAQTPEAGMPLHVARGDRGGLRPVAVGYFATIYFGSMYLATFFNVAFYKQILNALKEEPVSIGAGLRFALTKWRAILAWTLFAGLVGYLIKNLEQRSGLIGQWVLRLLGTAWSIACVFVIPVIITEAKASNPFAVLKQSALILKKTWGESLIGYAGVSFGGGLVAMVSLLSVALGVGICLALHAYLAIIAVVLLWLATMVVWGYLLNVAGQIFRCALYLYATEGTLPQPYTEEMAAMAWKHRKA